MSPNEHVNVAFKMDICKQILNVGNIIQMDPLAFFSYISANVSWK